MKRDLILGVVVYHPEYIQIIILLNEQKVPLKQWESTSGFASYFFKYAMNVAKQLHDSKTLYSEDIKERAERWHKANNAAK